MKTYKSKRQQAEELNNRNVIILFWAQNPTANQMYKKPARSCRFFF